MTVYDLGGLIGFGFYILIFSILWILHKEAEDD